MRDGPAYDNCTKVTDFCTVDQTVYGYTPNLGINVFYLAWFSLFFMVTIFQGLKYKSLWYNAWIATGAAGELAGYGGRVAMHFNPWNKNAFMDQIAALIFSPSFFAAAIYLTLKHMVRAVGPEYSPIPASLYAWGFIVCDLISLLLQAAGGGVAAGANDDKTSAAGGHIMLAGIVFQVITFTTLYLLVACVAFKMYKNRANLKVEVLEMLRSRDFKIFAGGIFIASLAIYIRCVYRIAELAGGWANHIMRDEVDYIVLDGAMCSIAVCALCVSHPGMFFKSMLTKNYPAVGGLNQKTASEVSTPLASGVPSPGEKNGLDV